MKLNLQPLGVSVSLEPSESVLSGLLRLGYQAPHSCLNGNCQRCVARLLSGRVSQFGVELTAGEVLSCQAELLEDSSLYWDELLAPGALPVVQLSCQVLDCQPLGGDVWRLELLAPAGALPRYHAGQYLLIERADGKKSAFSLASAPHQGRTLELHILAREESALSLLDELRHSGLARIQLPMGDVHLAQLPDGPLVLIAAGTGMAQMHSMLQHCLARGFAHPIHLYWGARRPEDFYSLPAWSDWQTQPNLHLHQVVSEPAGPEWRQALLHEAIRQDFPSLKGLHLYASGSPAMVYATLDALVEAGLEASQMQADVFAYAPRKT